MAGTKEALLVKRIESGTVIDHIPPNMSLVVARLLGVLNGRFPVLIAINVESKKMGRKDVLKLEGRFLDENELGKVAILAPGATVNIIDNGRVSEKKKLKLPTEIEGMFRCANPDCITNKGEPVRTRFYVVKSNPLVVRCHYCGRDMDRNQIIENLI